MARIEIEISLDGDMWCALIGENLQEGVAGFDSTPLGALRTLCDELEHQPYSYAEITLGGSHE